MWRDDDGITAIEYGLVALLIALATAGAIGLVGTEVDNMYQAIAAAFT